MRALFAIIFAVLMTGAEALSAELLATQITPTDIRLSILSSGPTPNGNKVTTIIKNPTTMLLLLPPDQLTFISRSAIFLKRKRILNLKKN